MTSDNQTPLDPATVQHCIEALRGSGRYDKDWERLSDMDEPHLVERWTYTTHPMDILAALIKPEPTEAEKLVDEWLNGNMDEDDQDYVRLAQFILDRVSAQLTFPSTEGVTVTAMQPEQPQPQYIFSPWIEWKGGERPVPGDWMVEWLIKDETVERYTEMVARAGDLHWGPDTIKAYRVRFEVGKWYDWTGGPCPVDESVTVEVFMRDEYQCNGAAREFTLAGWDDGDCWTYTSQRDDHIIRFKVLAA